MANAYLPMSYDFKYISVNPTRFPIEYILRFNTQTEEYKFYDIPALAGQDITGRALIYYPNPSLALNLMNKRLIAAGIGKYKPAKPMFIVVNTRISNQKLLNFNRMLAEIDIKSIDLKTFNLLWNSYFHELLPQTQLTVIYNTQDSRNIISQTTNIQVTEGYILQVILQSMVF